MPRFNSKTLPENIRRCMPTSARKELGTPTLTESQEKANRQAELELHRQFESWCKLNEIVFVHSRTDRKSTIAVGHPDFTLLRGGRGCCVEFKVGSGKLSEDQMGKLEQLNQAGVPIFVAWDLASAINFAKTALGFPELGTCAQHHDC